MASIVPFISNAVFESTDIALMSDAYDRAMENVHGFGRPNKIVEQLIARRIISLTHGGERDPKQLCKQALAACGFEPEKRRREES
ncbi:MAG: hypothetical protein WA776_20390 [Xanthobacteraceae bacterium]